MRTGFAAAAVCGAIASFAGAASIYVMSSGDAVTDNAVVLALTSRGHTVTVGVPYTAFDGSVALGAFQTVYLQDNYDWTAGFMPAAGQQQLVDWVNAGGRLVTCEWTAYFAGEGSYFAGLRSILPMTPSTYFTAQSTCTMTLLQHNDGVDAGVPETFTCPLDNYAGTETLTVAQPGASTYFRTNFQGTDYATLVGWRRHLGYVYSFLTTCGPTQVSDPAFGQLFSNAMSAITPPCETADFNHDGDVGTDADISAFFACLAGNCCPTCDSADFNADGDLGTDADIEEFFHVLAGGAC